VRYAHGMALNDDIAPGHPDYDRLVDIYVDESSHTGHAYRLFGALLVPTANAAELEELIAETRLPELPHPAEMGWKNVSKAKAAAYYRVVDLFFKNPGNIKKPFDYHCLFFNKSRTDDRTYNKGSRQIGLGKEMYQLIMRCARMHRKSLFRLYPDDSEKIEEDALKLRIILNRRLAKEETKRQAAHEKVKHGLTGVALSRWLAKEQREKDERVEPFRRVKFIKSHDSMCLQLADVLTGAIAYELNGHKSAPEASSFRVPLSQYIVMDREQGFGIVGNIIDGTSDWGRWTVRPFRW
jgi:hypothetical protein